MAHMQSGMRTSSPSQKKTNRPITQNAERQNEHVGDSSENVGGTERILCGLVGGGLLLRSFRRGGSGLIGGLTALMGIALLQRAATGYCPAYSAMGMSTHDHSTLSLGRRKDHTNRTIKTEQSITIERSARELYQFWRQIENLPKVMSHLRSVEAINDHKSHWIAETIPGAPTIEWDAEIINEVENERIGWSTLEGASVEHAGSVAFETVNETATKVTVTLQYDPPGGPLGAALLSLIGQDPGKKIRDDLDQFKKAMEGETARSSR